jgi:Domain of unknown function (DUF4157)
VRVHTDSSAAEAAHAIQARAFTTGRDVAFAAGEYNPDSREGRRLLAHELAHVDQPPQKVRRDAGNPPPPPAAPPDPSAVTAARVVILDALEGYTSKTDSEKILKQFRGKSAAMVLAIVNEVENYGSLKHSKSLEQMFEWLLDDLTELDRRELRKILVNSGSPDAQRIIIGEIKDLLDGYTSEDDSAQIYALLAGSVGAGIDKLLVGLETAMHQTRDVMRGQLFGDLDRVNAERVRQRFFEQGGPIAANGYAAPWTARKIMDLIEGYTSHSDSTDIVWLFSKTQPEMRGPVQLKLEELTRAGRGQSVSDVLMHDLDASDYERLRKMGGLDLLPYKDTKSFAEKAISVLEWPEIVAEWVVCGIVGLATGLFVAAWDIIKSVKDVVVAVWDLIWSLVYLLSNGAAGSENWLRVKTFFIGIGDLVTEPGKVWDSYWEQTKLEFNTIQGPFSDCRVAELLVRKLVVAIVNILLIFLAGYGLAKGAVAGARAVAAGAELAEIIGVRGVISVAGRLATRRIGRFVAAGAEVGTKLLEAIRKPSTLMRALRIRLRAVMIAAEDVGYWRYLRKQTGVAVQAARDAASDQIAGERRYWDENRKFWRDRATAQQAREQDLAPDIRAIEERAKVNERPDPQSVVDDLGDEAQQLDKESAQLHTDVAGRADPLRAEGGAPASGSTGQTPAPPAQPAPPVSVAESTADINALIEEALGDFKLESSAPLNPADFGPKPRVFVSSLRDIDLAEIPVERLGYYDAAYPGYVQRRQAQIAAGIRPNRPILSAHDYARFRWGREQGILVQGRGGGAVDLSRRGVIEQGAGHVLEKVIDARLPGSSNATAFPNPFGKACIPDHLPPGNKVVFLDQSGYKTTSGTRFSARFVGDSKYRTYIDVTDQTRGFVNLARFSDERTLVFYMRWQEGFPAIEGLTFDQSLGGHVLPVRPWNEALVSPELRALARDRGVKIRVVTDPIWK